MSSMVLATEDSDVVVATARDALRAAHDAKADALLRLKEAMDAQARGNAMVAELHAQIQQHDDAGERIVEEEAQHLVNLASGRPAPRPRDRDAGEDPEERARQRRQLEVKLIAAKKAQSRLEEEVATEKRVVDKANHAISAAIEAILIEMGDDLVDELIAAERRARNIRIELTGLSGVWLRNGGNVGPIRLGRRAAGALADLPLNDTNRQRPPRAAYDPEGSAAARYRELAAALMADPDATVPGMDD
jgi:hypothetical protein